MTSVATQPVGTSETCLESRRPGRPRDPRASAAILDATLELLVRDGLTALSLTEVATHAGVGKATIYRWWAGKDELVVDALTSLAAVSYAPLTGDARADVTRCLVEVLISTSRSMAGQILPRLMGEATPELQRLFWERCVAPQRAHMAAALRQGIDAGELRIADVEVVIDMLVGPVVMRHCLAGVREPLALEDAPAVVAVVLDGLRTR